MGFSAERTGERGHRPLLRQTWFVSLQTLIATFCSDRPVKARLTGRSAGRLQPTPTDERFVKLSRSPCGIAVKLLPGHLDSNGSTLWYQLGPHLWSDPLRVPCSRDIRLIPRFRVCLCQKTESLVDKPAPLDARSNHRRGAPGEKSCGRFFVSGAGPENSAIHPHISRANQRMRPMMRISSAVRS